MIPSPRRARSPYPKYSTIFTNSFMLYFHVYLRNSLFSKGSMNKREIQIQNKFKYKIQTSLKTNNIKFALYHMQLKSKGFWTCIFFPKVAGLRLVRQKKSYKKWFTFSFYKKPLLLFLYTIRAIFFIFYQKKFTIIHGNILAIENN